MTQKVRFDRRIVTAVRGPPSEEEFATLRRFEDHTARCPICYELFRMRAWEMVLCRMGRCYAEDLEELLLYRNRHYISRNRRQGRLHYVELPRSMPACRIWLRECDYEPAPRVPVSTRPGFQEGSWEYYRRTSIQIRYFR